MHTATRFGQVAGTLYVAAGILGFAMTGLDGFVSPHGEVLLGISVNPLQNLLHLLAGGALLVGASLGDGAARSLALLAGASFGVAGLFGLALVGSDANVLALNHAGNALHLTTAAAASVAALVSTRRLEAVG